MPSIRRWLVMISLSLSGGIIFMLPFLREVYYIPLQQALHLSNTQLGLLSGVFGTTSIISYFPGGWVADRFSPRKLMTFSLAATGIAGLYFATFPSFAISILIHAIWGVSITLTFWSALIKGTRNWAPPTEQGRAFGILESGRGIAELASSTVFLAVFARLGGGNRGLSWVILLFSFTNILLALMTWLVMSDSVNNGPEDGLRKRKVGSQEVFRVLRMPVVWLISVVILTAYSAYWGSFYFTPYATDVFKMSVVFGGAIGVGKMYLKPATALGAGFLADHTGIAKTVASALLILVLSFIAFAFMPGSHWLVAVLVVNTAIASLAIFALRGIYFALLEEGGVPLAVTGTATGIVSVAGYTPDIFMPMVGGIMLDHYPGPPGYRLLFLLIAGLCLLGFFAALLIRHREIKSGRTRT
ncbi:MAG: nitrate/nitrite transporter [Terriglobia bacterium]